MIREGPQSDHGETAKKRGLLARARVPLLVLAILAAYPLLSYNPQISGYLSLLGTLVIALLARAAWPGDWRRRIGLAVPRRALLPALLLALASAALAAGIIAHTAQAAGIAFLPIGSFDPWPPRAAQTVGQSLNEELVLGALLLDALRRRLRRCRPIAISLAVALLFALFHQGFYALRPPSDPGYGILSLPALAAIFAVGVLRNNLILATRHVAFSWAIHLGWNIVFFGSAFVFASSGAFLTEPQRFDAFLGCWMSVAAAVLAAGCSSILLRGRLLARPEESQKHA